MHHPFPIKSPRKLIEVALPLDAINAACAREKSIRHGHPSALHLWWARRPLAVTLAPNEMPYALNQSDKFHLAIVLVGETEVVEGPFYLQNPFDTEPGWGVSSLNYDLRELLARATHFTHASKLNINSFFVYVQLTRPGFDE